MTLSADNGRIVSRTLSVAALAIGTLVLVGYVLHIEALMRVAPGFVNMKANTAIAFAALGISGFLSSLDPWSGKRARMCARALAVLVCCIGSATLIEYVSGHALGIDELVFRDVTISVDTSNLGRMAPNTAFNFVLLGLAFFLITSGPKAITVAQVLGLLALIVAAFALIGYLFGAQIFVTIASLNRMALHTMAAFFLVGTAVLTARANHGFMRLVLEDSPGGFLARRFLPTALLLPIGFGALVLMGLNHGLYDQGFSLALLVCLMTAALGTAIWTNVREANRAELRRRALEAERAQAEIRARAAGEASQLKSSFLAHVSHEIRTPINAVIGMADLLGRTPLTAKQREMTTVLSGGAESLLAIINDILDFSKIEAGKLRLDLAEMPLRPLVEQTVALLAPRASEKGIKLVCQMGPDLDQLFYGDAGRIRQILTNLLGNAVKFTDRGEIVVKIDLVRMIDDQSTIRIAVRDTGTGISEEVQARLFQPFSQADDAAARGGGTGLGLAISRQLTDLMQGRIGVTSQPGRGSTFWVEFPLRIAADRSTSAVEPPVQKTSGIELAPGFRLLVADDNAANQTVARMLLADMHVDADFASTGEAVLKLLRDRTYDAILMDCQMPVLDGYETTRRIRAGLATGVDRALPIIGLTAYAMAEDRAKSLEAGMNEHLTKPIRREQLLEAFARCGLGAQTANGMASAPPVVPGLSAPVPVVFDAACLDMLRTLPGQSGPSLLPELLSLLLQETPVRLAELARAVADQKTTESVRLAHLVAGSCSNLGAHEICATALKLEQTAKVQNWAAVDPLLREIAIQWERVEVSALSLIGASNENTDR